MLTDHPLKDYLIELTLDQLEMIERPMVNHRRQRGRQSTNRPANTSTGVRVPQFDARVKRESPYKNEDFPSFNNLQASRTLHATERYFVFQIKSDYDEITLGTYLNNFFKPMYPNNSYTIKGYQTLFDNNANAFICFPGHPMCGRNETNNGISIRSNNIIFEELNSEFNKIYIDIDYYNGSVVDFIRLASMIDTNSKSIYIYHNLDFKYEECVIFHSNDIFFIKKIRNSKKRLSAHIVYHNTYMEKNALLGLMRSIKHPVLRKYIEYVKDPNVLVIDNSVYKGYGKCQKFRLSFCNKEPRNKNGIFQYAMSYPYWYLSRCITVAPATLETIDRSSYLKLFTHDLYYNVLFQLNRFSNQYEVAGTHDGTRARTHVDTAANHDGTRARTQEIENSTVVVNNEDKSIKSSIRQLCGSILGRITSQIYREADKCNMQEQLQQLKSGMQEQLQQLSSSNFK